MLMVMLMLIVMMRKLIKSKIQNPKSKIIWNNIGKTPFLKV